MEIKEAVIIFENVEIRKIEFENEIFVPAIDVAKALGYNNPAGASNQIVENNKARFDGYEKIVSVKSGRAIRPVRLLNLIRK